MKRQVQLEGVRKWAGDYLLELQDEPLKVLDSFFGGYGSYILSGCAVSANGDLYDAAPGLVALAGKDRSGADAVMVVPFAGATGMPMPLYLTLAWDVRQEAYVNGAVQPIAYDYYAKVSAVEPDAGTAYLLLNDATPRFPDIIQDDSHRMLTSAQVAAIDAAPKYHGKISAGVDANSLRNYGIYQVSGANMAGNFPEDGMIGVMVVSVADVMISQKIMSLATGIIWERIGVTTSNGVNWWPWNQAAKSDLSNVQGGDGFKVTDISGWTGILSITSAGADAQLTKSLRTDALYMMSVKYANATLFRQDALFRFPDLAGPINISAPGGAGGSGFQGYTLTPGTDKILNIKTTSSNVSSIYSIFEILPR